jgi:archaeal type IV pilus assembly protein PilA
MNFRKIRRNLRKDMRGISPVIATLLMIAIAVVASLVVYAWTMGYMSFTTGKTGKSILVQSAAHASPSSTIYVQNVGDSTIKMDALQSVYINGTLLTTGVSLGNGFSSGSLLASATGQIVITDGTNSWTPKSGDNAQIKLTTVDGTQTQYTWYVP